MENLVIFLTALWPLLRARSMLPALFRVAMNVLVSALRKGLLDDAWKVRWEQRVPADPSMSEQEEAENSREEKRTEEHLESGKQEEEKLATRLLSPPNLPPLLLLKLLLAACCPSTLAKPLP